MAEIGIHSGCMYFLNLASLFARSTKWNRPTASLWWDGSIQFLWPLRHCTPNCVPLASRLGGKFEHKLSSKQSDVNKCLCLASLNTSATQPLGQRDAIRCMEDEKPTRMIFSPGPLFFITHDFLLFDVFFVHLSAASSPSLLVSLWSREYGWCDGLETERGDGT